MFISAVRSVVCSWIIFVFLLSFVSFRFFVKNIVDIVDIVLCSWIEKCHFKAEFLEISILMNVRKLLWTNPITVLSKLAFSFIKMSVIVDEYYYFRLEPISLPNICVFLISNCQPGVSVSLSGCTRAVLTGYARADFFDKVGIGSQKISAILTKTIFWQQNHSVLLKKQLEGKCFNPLRKFKGWGRRYLQWLNAFTLEPR